MPVRMVSNLQLYITMCADSSINMNPNAGCVCILFLLFTGSQRFLRGSRFAFIFSFDFFFPVAES